MIEKFKKLLHWRKDQLKHDTFEQLAEVESLVADFPGETVVDKVREMKAKIESLEGGQWKTADGVTIHRDMPVYVITDNDGIQIDGLNPPECSCFDAYTVEQAYFTKAAARAAMERAGEE